MSFRPVFTASLLPSFAAALLVAFTPSAARAGSVENDSKDQKVAKEIAAQKPFPFHFSLTAGYDSYFVFRGINLLPEQNVNVRRAVLPIFQQAFAGFGLTRDDIKRIVGPDFPTRVRIARESGIGYFDGAVTYSPSPKFGSLTVGGFYALQTDPRIEPGYFGGSSFFNDYKEVDLFGVYSHAFGPINVSLGGTYYHVRRSSTFDTLELNFKVDYTPKQFRYVTASFSYNYTGSLNYDPEYLDGHYLEGRLTGNIPVWKNHIDFKPFMLLSAGSGIVPRAFNTVTPTFFTQQKVTPFVQTTVASALLASDLGVLETARPALQQIANNTAGNLLSVINPANLDRDFDLNNFQTGVRVPVYLTSFLTLTGDFNYSRPLGNLRGEPYSQKDIVWGGLNLNLSF